MSSKETTWMVVKHLGTGELTVVNSNIRHHQVQLWACNGISVPSRVIKEFFTPEEALAFLIEMQVISHQIDEILKKDD